MRATTTLAGTSLTLLLAACSGGVKLASIPPGCISTNTMMVTYDPVPGGTITPDNDCIHVIGGTDVMIIFMPTPELRDAHVKYERLIGNGWLNRKNDDEMNLDTIVVNVPIFEDDDDDDEEEDFRDFKFDIRIKGVDRLDPRIVVE